MKELTTGCGGMVVEGLGGVCCKYLDVKAARALSFLQLKAEENARVSQRWTSQTSVIPLIIQRTQQEGSGHIAQKFHPVLEGGMVRTQFKCS